MARTSALGYWLKSSKGKGKQRVASGDSFTVLKGSGQETSVMGVKKVKRDGQIWMVRGGVWIAALGLSVGVDVAGKPFVMKAHPALRAQHISIGSFFDWRIPVDSIWAHKITPGSIIASCFVVLTWNPWENHVNKANVQGRGLRMKGTDVYVVSLI